VGDFEISYDLILRAPHCRGIRCDGNNPTAVELHPCPYLVSIGDQTECDCCAMCEEGCRNSVDAH
jgi:hypothetical protein